MLNTDEGMGRTWGEVQAARLEALASDSGHRFKSRRYDNRRRNGDPSFGARMADARRFPTLQNDSAANSTEDQATRADIDALIAQIREISRLRY
jgi:hypothetical protein